MAKTRRQEFKTLIALDPRRALDEAVPMVVRQQLPGEILDQLEERVSDTGVIRVYQAGPESKSHGEPSILRYAETKQGETFQAHVYGRRAADVKWTPNASLIGVAIDGQMAVSDSPLRRLEVGEVPDPNKEVVQICPVSGLTTSADAASAEPIAEGVPVVEAQGQIVYLCDGSHTTVFEQLLIQGESSSGNAQSFTGILQSAPTPSVGVVKVLYIPVIFADQEQTPASEATMQDTLRQVGEFYQASSYGRLTLVGTVTPPMRLSRNQAWYRGKDATDGFIKEIDGLGMEMVHAREAARAAGYDWLDYHCIMVRDVGGARSPISYGGGGNVWMRTDSVSTASHEIGHAFGLLHANFWVTNGASVIGPGGNEEYGDIYDNMGTGTPPTAHWNVQAKNQIKWLPDEFNPPITESGNYRIYALDTAKLDNGKRYGLRIRKDQDRTYWGEFRTLINNNWVRSGLLLGWHWPYNGGDNLQLLDTTPGSINGKLDAPISLGATFSDFEAGIHITTVAVNSAAPPSVDVVVNFGQFAGNQPPSLALSPSSAVIPLNSPITFTAVASDPENDTLSYAWVWPDDLISPNAPSATRSFSAAGVYTLNCIVSDMKGGKSIRKAVITVGNGGSRYSISGRIASSEGQGIPGVNVTASGNSGTLTDSEGYYTISNLAGGTYTITPAAHGLTFNALFKNSILVGPNALGANFVADHVPVVSITAPVPSAFENGAPGQFRLTRTGSTASPLTVYVFLPGGTAAKGLDYNFSPNFVFVGPLSTFTFPADQSSIDIDVPAINDSIQEGYETITLQLGADGAYLLGQPNIATIGLFDDDTSRPRVSLTCEPGFITENGARPAVCTVTRTGATTSSLSVDYTVAPTNTAAPGSDYQPLSGTIAIPAGAQSASFAITPIDDSVSEITETVNITIATGASFIADAAANSIAVRIIDDDVQTVDLTVADGSATEVDRTAGNAALDPGTFLVTRSGDLSAALTVYYGATGTALHGVDYEALAGSVVIPAGQSQAPITIMPRFDGIGEMTETVIVTLAAGSGNYVLGANYTGAVTIADAGDPPLLELAAISSPAVEGGAAGAFRITAKGSYSGSLTVNYTVSGTATAGTDYTIPGLNNATFAGTASVVLSNNTATSDLTVSVIDDGAVEGIENVTMTLAPSPNYRIWDATKSATVRILDNELPTVFIDPQVSTGGNAYVSESATATTCKFFISRTGSTTSALTINYSMIGTATNGVDYTSLSGTATIPAGVSGVDVSFKPLSDAVFEGTETVTMHLLSGAYDPGPDATIYLNDDDPGTRTVAFASAGGSGMESTTTVNIPVTLSSPAPEPVTVEYSLDGGTQETNLLSGTWVRVVRNGSSFDSYASPDGVTWTKIWSTQTVTMSSANYFAGIVLSSKTSTATASAQIDHVAVSGLSAGGSVGTATSGDVAGSSPPGSDSVAAGVYHLVAGGASGITTGPTDGMHYLFFPIANSANCTITARVCSIAGTTTNIRTGVMIRETLENNAAHLSALVEATMRNFQVVRTSAATNATWVSPGPPSYAKPTWLRLSRMGDTFTASTSADGITFAPIGGEQTLPIDSELLVGLATSSRTDGLLAQAVFDNVAITPAPATPLRGRTIGFVNETGHDTASGDTFTLTGSGAGFLPTITSTHDEGHFLATSILGDFTLTARLVSIEGGASNAQAGLMVRESSNPRSRCAYFGLTGPGTSGTEFLARRSSTTTGEGFGIDYMLPAGLLTFAPGEVSKNIELQISDDSLPEPPEFVNVVLRNAHAALLGQPATFTYTIVDDDTSTSLPVVGFAGATSTGPENLSPAQIPVVLSGLSSGTTTINYTIGAGGTATPGSDFTAVSGTLTFAPGEALKTITLPVLNDTAVEPNETVILTLSSPTGAVLGSSFSHTFTIQDDDTPLVTIETNLPTATEGGDSGSFTISRTGSLAGALTVNFTVGGTATSGSDYTAFSPPTSITIPAGQPSIDLVVTPIQNTAPEIDETVIVTLATGSGYTIGSPNAITVTIADDDVNTVTIMATDAIASEAGANPGEFTLLRSGPTTASLAVTIAVTGTATGGNDYSLISTSKIFAVGQNSVIIPVTVTQDSYTEGNEEVVVSINTSPSYKVGTPSVANVTIVDDDLPPSVYVSSPTSKATIIAADNGLLLTATGVDDGLPNPLIYTWSTTFGPGTVIFGDPMSATTSATFSAPGVYGLRVVANDGQFDATDDIFVQCGGLGSANWISVDQSQINNRGVSGESNGTFTLIASGFGYAGSNDSGHMLFRQLRGGTGDCTIVARLVSLSGPSTSVAGLTVRDTSYMGAKRANLQFNGTTLEFRSRMSQNTTGTGATAAVSAAPIWLKLARVGDTMTASTAPDVSGTPGNWATVGSPSTITMSADLIVGLIASTATGTKNMATAVFDHVEVTPAFSGPAVHSENLGFYSIAGNSGVAGEITTINGFGTHDTGGHFRYQQVWGDCMITARVTSHAGTTRGAQSGVLVRDTTDTGAFAFYGVTSIDGNQVHWRSTTGGNINTLQTGGSGTSWYRLVRRGNTVNAFRADDSGGVPGAWIQVSGNIPVTLTGPVLVGLLVDSNSSTLSATGTFTGFSVAPLNTAPVIAIAAPSQLPPFALDATVTDDGLPNPPGAFSVAWSKISGPGTVTFDSPASIDALATLGQSGDYTLRLSADDGDSQTFRDLIFSGYNTPFEQWQAVQFAATGGLNDPTAAATLDPDFDGLNNLLEYAIGTPPTEPNTTPITSDTVTIGPDRFLRLTVPKNPAATDLQYEVQANASVAQPLTWSSSGLIIELNDATTLRVRDNVPLGSVAPPSHFLRLQLTRP